MMGQKGHQPVERAGRARLGSDRALHLPQVPGHPQSPTRATKAWKQVIGQLTEPPRTTSALHAPRSSYKKRDSDRSVWD